MYSSVTRDIKVSVQPVFLDEQSDPDSHRYVWAYRVVIENQGPKTVQLLNRYWRITDSRGSTQEVRFWPVAKVSITQAAHHWRRQAVLWSGPMK